MLVKVYERRKRLCTALFALLALGWGGGTALGMQVTSLPSVPGIRATNANGWVMYAGEQVVGEPVTISATVQLGEGWTDLDSDAPTVQLIGLAHQPGAAPDALALSWQLDHSGWFPTWKLVWSGDLLQTGAIEPASGNSQPTEGHTYEATLSYSPATGAVSAALVDKETHEAVYTAAISARSSTAALYLSTGITTEVAQQAGLKPAPVTISDLRLARQYLPLGDEWTVGIRSGNSFTPGWGFAADDQGYVRINTLSPLETGGHYEITRQTDNSSTKLADVQPASVENWVRLPIDTMPLGRSQLVIAYVSAGRTWLWDKCDIQVGKVDLSFRPLQYDRIRHSVNGSLAVSSASRLAALPVQVEAVIYARKWDPVGKWYKKTEYSRQVVYNGVVDAGGAWGTQDIPLSLPVPTELGMWEVTMQATTQTEAIVISFDAALAFNTYQPATIEDGKPFTIAVIPDSQFYANVGSFNQIFLRQAQWIAENAAEKNIVLALHMGDITHLNRPNEWQVAQNSMKTLDNVVPYVLAVGNHDTFVGTKWTTGASPINEFFPASSFPYLAGTLEPNRIDNAYYTFKFGGTDYLILSLEFSPRDAALDWANEVVAAHPNHRVIVVTHAYLNANGSRVKEPNLPPGTNDSYTIWDKFVRKHKNILLVLAGHVPEDAVTYSIDVGDNRNVVYNLLFDYQSEENGGNGFLGLLEFMPDNTINVSAYSPYLDQYKTGRGKFGFAGRYVIPIGQLPLSQP